MLIERQHEHAHLPKATADERARQDFVQTFKFHLARKVVPDIHTLWDEQVEPDFLRKKGRPPASGSEVAEVMEGEHLYQMWSSLYRTAQEMIWSSVNASILRQREDMAEKAKIAQPKGSLELNPAVETPRYLSALDIHCMPGGYHGEAFEGDVSAGALYDRGAHIYGMGGLGPKLGRMGEILSTYLRQRFPDLKVARILDLGCTVGHSVLPYAETFPGAELHGIDVAAPVLRYAHARSEARGVEVHYKQMSAETLDYPDDHFDLVVSHILLHETSSKAIRNILAESRRVCRPGGVVAHIDMGFFDSMRPFDTFMMMFDGPNNNEPFWNTFRRMDAGKLLADAGFDADKQFTQALSRAYSGQAIFSEGKADGGRGSWFLLGGVK